MVLALYVVAGLMAAGGLIAIYSGSDIIVMERGWTMVIAGSVVAASGALLAGIATAVARLQGLEREFARISERLVRSQPPSAVGASGLGEGRKPATDVPSPPPLIAVPDIGQHRDLDIRPEPVLHARPVTKPVADAVPDDIFAAAPEPLPKEPIPREPDPAPEEQADRAAATIDEEPPAPTIVGTYNSGGNFYIMYSDGSIEAETPAGKFRFGSLDELKEFIAAGGDKAKATS